MAPLRSMGNIGNMYSPYEDVFASTGGDTQSPYPNMFPYGNRGIWGGGEGNEQGGTGPQSERNYIEYIDIATTGNSTDFGNLVANREFMAGGVSNRTRGIFAGGQGNTDVIQYITIASPGNASDFGDLTQSRNSPGGGSSMTRGVFAGGSVNPGGVPGGYGETTIDYITIDSAGNATDFGDLPYSRGGMYTGSTGPAGEIMYMFGGADGNGYSNDMAYLTIATTGNATDMWGSLDGNKSHGASGADKSRFCIAGGRTSGSPYRTDQIEYHNYGGGGNAQDFGDLTGASGSNRMCSGTSSSDSLGRFVIGGGESGGGIQNVLQYVAIQTTGDSVDFGDLLSTKEGSSALSGDAA
mgnify:CR=1 FL=1